MRTHRRSPSLVSGVGFNCHIWRASLSNKSPVLQFLPCITNMNSKIAITKQTLDSDWHSNHPNYGLVELCTANQRFSSWFPAIWGCPNPKIGVPPKSSILVQYFHGFSILNPPKNWNFTSIFSSQFLPRNSKDWCCQHDFPSAHGRHRGITTDQRIAAFSGPLSERTARFLVGFCWGSRYIGHDVGVLRFPE